MLQLISPGCVPRRPEKTPKKASTIIKEIAPREWSFWRMGHFPLLPLASFTASFLIWASFFPLSPFLPTSTISYCFQAVSPPFSPLSPFLSHFPYFSPLSLPLLRKSHHVSPVPSLFSSLSPQFCVNAGELILWSKERGEGMCVCCRYVRKEQFWPHKI